MTLLFTAFSTLRFTVVKITSGLRALEILYTSRQLSLSSMWPFEFKKRTLDVDKIMHSKIAGNITSEKRKVICERRLLKTPFSVYKRYLFCWVPKANCEMPSKICNKARKISGSCVLRRWRFITAIPVMFFRMMHWVIGADDYSQLWYFKSPGFSFTYFFPSLRWIIPGKRRHLVPPYRRSLSEAQYALNRAAPACFTIQSNPPWRLVIHDRIPSRMIR